MIAQPAHMRRQHPPPIIAAYYYPGWHASPDRSIGSGASEWNLLYDPAPLRFLPDIRRPNRPPTEPTIDSLQAEIITAMRGGIDAFFWCWYWDHGKLLLNQAMEMFLQCEIPAGFGYALMWVNKRPHFRLPLDRPASRLSEHSRFVYTDEKDFALMVQHLIEHHWSRPSYLKLNGRPMLSVYCVEPLIHRLGPERLAKILEMGNRMAQAAGFPGIYYVAIVHRLHKANHWLEHLPLHGHGRMPLAKMGFDAISSYVYLPQWDGPARQSYAKMIDRRTQEWPEFSAQYGLPYWPSLSPGWDARARGVIDEQNRQAYPWAPVITDATPEHFARWLELWKNFAIKAGDVPVLPVASWNEWSEGHAIAPCDRYGDAMLQAIRRFKSSFIPAESPLAEHDIQQASAVAS